MGDGPFVMYNNLGTSGWGWVRLFNAVLTAGEHTLTIAYRENGALLDKICISTDTNLPEGMGKDAENLCDPAKVGNRLEMPERFGLKQNYPNPFNPTTHIQYTIDTTTKVTLKIFDMLGREIQVLVNDVKLPGQYTVTFDAHDLSSGIYFYSLHAGSYSETKKFSLLQ